MQHDPVLDDLRAVFPAVPIVAASAFEQRGQLYCDTHEYRAALDGKTWRQLDPHVIARRSDALWFLGDEHLRAVLPAYLELSIVLSPMRPVAGELFAILTRRERLRGFALAAWRTSRFDRLALGLAPAQTCVVARVLRRFIELYPNFGEPAQVALDRYWAGAASRYDATPSASAS